MQLPPPPVASSSDLIVSVQEPWGQAPAFPDEIVVFVPGAVTCGGSVVEGARLEPTAPVLRRRYAPVARDDASAAYTLDFTIAAEGRAVDIRRGGTSRTGFNGDAGELAAALAASSFAAGAPRERCSVTYGTSATPLALAPLPLVYEAVAVATQNEPAAGAWDRARPIGSDCKRTPEPRETHYPAFERIDQPAGTRGWTVLAFDVDASGVTRNVRVLGSTGNATLDRASLDAVTASRFVPGSPRQGCLFRYFRSGANLPAPPIPADQRDDGENPACRIDPRSIPRLLDGSAFPQPFSRRGIEGWAVVRYDTAPWGQIGNVKVVAAEPADAFGDAALSGMFSARVAESETGRRGCMQRIKFRLPQRR